MDESGTTINENESKTEGGEKDMNPNVVSILKDAKFEQGFLVRGLGQPIYGDAIEYFGDMYDPMVRFDYEKKGLRPAWNLCQWASRYPFHDKENTTFEEKNGGKTFNYRFTDKGDGVYLYENQSKTVEVNTATGEIRLALKGSECYTQTYRTQGQEWPHLLLEQNIKAPTAETKVSDCSSIRVTLDARLNAFADNMNGTGDPSLHSAIFMFYLFVANYDPNTHKSTDMLWFGIPVFDNRYAYVPQMSFPDVGSKGSASGKWIFNIASSAFYREDNSFYDHENHMIFDQWVTVDVELTSRIKHALREAQNAGYMKDASWDNLYINGMYMGFEIPGNYDIDMSVKNVDILMEKIPADK